MSAARSLEASIGGPVHYVDHGGEGPPLVLVHGLGGSHVNWCAVGDLLAKNHRVRSIDLPGFGLTRLHGRKADVDSNAKVLTRFVREVVGGKATLVGNSMGGLITLLVAADAPELVKSAVLVNAAVPHAKGAPADRQVGLMFATYMIPWVGERALRKYSAKLTTTQFVNQTMRLCAADARKLDPAHVAAHVALAEKRRNDPSAIDEGQAAFLAAARSLVRAVWNGRSGRAAKAIDAIRAPVLVLQGDRDRLVNVGSARAVAARRGWDLEVFEGIGHVPQLEIPERFVDVVTRWVARHEDGARSPASERAPVTAERGT